MKKTRLRVIAIAVAASLSMLSGGVGKAQDSAAPGRSLTGLAKAPSAAAPAAPARALSPDQWGLGTAVLTIAAANFVPYDHLTAYETFDQFRNRTGPGGTGFFDANVDLPSGAKITALEIEGCDEDAAADLATFLVDCPNLATCTLYPAGLITTSGTPGCTFFFDTFDGPVVNHFTNLYAVRVRLDSTSTATRFRAVRVYYNLQVSAAPATATFDDVPTGHPFFRFVEALSASGITGGCNVTPPLFCPDEPLTRGQMAVFLSAALGLYFPF